MQLLPVIKWISNFLTAALLITVFVSVSQAKGNKYGVFIGVNDYPDGINKLSGCVNDSNRVRDTMVKKFGFMKTNTSLLTDAQATRQEIMNQVKAYQNKVSAGDLFVFQYSGHGTLFPDAYSEDRDETDEQYMEGTDENGQPIVMYPRDKYDSAIVPFDARGTSSGKSWHNLILDDELYTMFKAFTDKGVQVVFISDSCHSGSVAKSKKIKTAVRFSPLYKVFGKDSFDSLALSPPKTTTNSGQPQIAKLYLALTGSKDNEFSLDGGGTNGEKMGLFTSTLLATLEQKGATFWNYEKLIKVVSPEVSRLAREQENDQNPQLDNRFGDPKMKIFSAPSATGAAQPPVGKIGKGKTKPKR